jgi:hypothetical protein
LAKSSSTQDRQPTYLKKNVILKFLKNKIKKINLLKKNWSLDPLAVISGGSG